MTRTAGPIGYYVHHQGHGHLHRALAVAHALRTAHRIEVVGLSSRAAPSGWPGQWVPLADDAVPTADGDVGDVGDVSAHGRLHYAPIGHPGLRTRMAQIAAWCAAATPSALVVDVSVEVALLARLHGVRVVTMAMPGRRTDAAHALGYGISDLVLAPWPVAATGLLTGPPDLAARLVPVGAIARYTPQPHPAPVDRGTAVLLNGTGGLTLPTPDEPQTGWRWRRLDGTTGWVADPWPELCRAEVVVAHCGQNAVAEIAAAGRPAVLVPQPRPFDEQQHTARAVARLGLPAVVVDDWPAPTEWAPLLEKAAGLDGSDWVRWNDGGGARRAADRLAALAVGRAR